MPWDLALHAAAASCGAAAMHTPPEGVAAMAEKTNKTALAWPYAPKTTRPNVKRALEQLSPEALALPAPEGAWLPPALGKLQRLQLSIEMLGRARYEPARELLERLYDEHHLPEIRAAAGVALIALLDDERLQERLGDTRAALAAKKPSHELTLGTLQHIQHWVEAARGAKPMKARHQPKAPTVNRKLLRHIAEEGYPFAFYHHGMPTDHERWSYLIHYARAPKPKQLRLIDQLLARTTGYHFTVRHDGQWTLLSIDDDAFEAVGPEECRQFQRDFDACLVTLHAEHDLAVAWCAKVDFGKRRRGDAWHRYSLAQAPFDEVAANCPFQGAFE